MTDPETHDKPSAVRATDHDGDTWLATNGGLWALQNDDPDDVLVLTEPNLVQQFGPITWYDADGNELGTSAPDGGR